MRRLHRKTHSHGRRSLSLLCILALCLGLLPAPAFAAGTDTGKAIQLGTSGISDPTKTTVEGSGDYWTPSDYIYFGVDSGNNTPVKWRVLDADKANDGTTDGMFLLSEYLLSSRVAFNNASSASNAYQGSNAQTWCSSFAANTSNFSTTEQTAMLGVAKNDSAASDLYGSISWGESSLTADDKLFFLSAWELANYVGNYHQAPGLAATDTAQSASIWWLRSPYADDNGFAGVVNENGNVYTINVDYGQVAVRPAFNLGTSKILFTSAANGGKSSGAVGADALTSVSDYTGNEWKLTLLDNTRSFNITSDTTVSIERGHTADISYSGAKTGDNEYVSAMIVDENGTILYYGRVAQNSESGTASVAIPADLQLGSYTLKMFNEQYNGDNKTDYASAFVNISLIVTDTTAPTLTEGTATRESDTKATVTFTSDETGSYYYAVVESGAAEPTDITSGTSYVLTSDTNTITLTNLTAGAKDIYIVAKDAERNVSSSLKIEIPEFILTYTISTSPAALNFASQTAGYTEAPAVQTVTITNTGNQTVTVNLPTSTNYTIMAGIGFETTTASLEPNSTATFIVQPKTGLAVGTYNETLTISSSESTSASVELIFQVDPKQYLVTVNGSYAQSNGAGDYAEGAMVAIDAGTRSGYTFDGWTSEDGVTFADASEAQTSFTMPGKVVTVTANWRKNASPSTPPIVTPPTVSEETTDAIADAQPGETVTVDLSSGDTTLDKEVFEALAGRDVTLVVDLGDGVSWTVKGSDVPEDADFTDIDMGVTMNSDGIPVDVVNAITGERSSVQITLAHDGAFGFTMTLTAPLGAENAGLWANLYHFDEDANAMTFETAAPIGSDGSVSLVLSHASQYAIVIDDHNHGVVTLPFTDVREGDWFYDPVCYVYSQGLMTGTSATTFEPNTSLSRAMLVAVLHRLEGSPQASGGDFTDVAEGDWYAQAVNWAASVGVVNGFDDGTFQPNTAITREQLAAILCNYAQYKGFDTSASGSLSTFTDAASVSDWAKESVEWAVGSGLLGGYEDSTLRPQGTTTRAEVASVLQRALGNVAGNQ